MILSTDQSAKPAFKWEKLGKVFDPGTVKDRPWLQEFAQAPATLVFDDFVRVYFSCRPPADAAGQYVRERLIKGFGFAEISGRALV